MCRIDFAKIDADTLLSNLILSYLILSYLILYVLSLPYHKVMIKTRTAKGQKALRQFSCVLFIYSEWHYQHLSFLSG